MAARLTVIISQSASRDSHTVDLEESLVAQLMMTPGLDATLIGPIETILVESTDFLCLSGFNHNFAFVSWLDEDQVVEHWRRLGVSGTVAPPGAIRADSDEAIQKPRVYYFQIDRRDAGASVLRSLQDLQRDRAVKTVGIGIGSQPQKTQTPMTPPVRAEKPVESPKPPSDVVRGRPVTHVSDSGAEDDEEDWQQLDQLVDDLDALDL